MAEERDFELPGPGEKLSYKFILDSLKESQQHAAMEEMPPEPEEEAAAVEPSNYQAITLEPGKKYFRIGEVSEVLGVEPYVLRYWEGEFKVIRPTKTGSGHRVYARKDVERLHHIKHLLHVEKFSIKGAKQKLSEGTKHLKQEVAPVQSKNRQVLKSLAHDLRELIHLAREN